MTQLTKQHIIVTLLLFTFMAFGTLTVYATSNTTNSTSTGQSEQERIITSKGCGEGWGYYMDDPTPICEPVDKIGQGPPKDMAFCAALGCPYNPPVDFELSDKGEGGGGDVTCAAVGCPEPRPVDPEPEPECPPGFYCIDDPIYTENPPESPGEPMTDSDSPSETEAEGDTEEPNPDESESEE